MHLRTLALICFATLIQIADAFAQGTAFTYQGRFQTNGVPYTGSAEFQFTLWDAASAGTSIAASTPASVTASVENGLFTVTLDFGATAFNGEPRFLQIEARTALGPFTTLTPRQPLTSTPYALRALNSASAGSVSGNVPVTQLTGTVPLSQLPTAVVTNGASGVTITGTFVGDGSGLTGLNASQLTDGIVPNAALSNAWKVGGNAGTTPALHFLGTTDNSPLEIRANNLRALRIEPTAGGPNLIGGNANNTIGVFTEYATIAGGRANQIGTNSDGSVIAGGGPNFIGTNASTGAIGGGVGNSIGNFTDSAVIAGGFENAIGTNLTAATIAGGAGNAIESGAGYSIVAGGTGNRVVTDVQNAFVAGTAAHALHPGAFVWADASAPSTPFASTTANQFNARAIGGVRFETAGSGLTVDGQPVVAGQVGTSQIANSAITVGKIAASAVTQTKIADSAVNSAKIADGSIQSADVDAANFNTTFWQAGGNSGTTPGTHFLGTTDNQPLEFKVNGERAFRLEPTLDDATHSNIVNVVGGSSGNLVAAGVYGATIAGGGAVQFGGTAATNRVNGDFGTIGGGHNNSVLGDGAVIAGGTSNVCSGIYSGVSSGNDNNNSGPYAFIGGGWQNAVSIFGTVATIGGGSGNLSSSPFSTIGGGLNNSIVLPIGRSVIAGGQGNSMRANSSGFGLGFDGNSIGGGISNTIHANVASTIAGGRENVIADAVSFSSIGGGRGNSINAALSSFSTIAGGLYNESGRQGTAIGGGSSNVVSGFHGTIPGGLLNTADGSYSFAAGRRAKAIHDGSFVWADSQNADFPSTINNQVRFRASGGMEVVGGSSAEALKFSGSRTGGFSTPVGLAQNNNTTGFSAPALRVVNAGGDSVDGALSVSAGGTGFIAMFGNSSQFVSTLSTNGTWKALAFNASSDRALKENFTEVNPSEVLEKVAALPMTRWTYKATPGVEHMGPIAQDFHAAFGLNGRDDKHIATVDADGVALAAIQGLNKKLEQELQAKEERIDALERQLTELKEMLTKSR